MTQAFKNGLHGVKPDQQGIELLSGCGIRAELFDFRFHSVRHFTEPQGAGQSSTALERVQRTQHLHARTQVVGTHRPLPQCPAQTRHQFGALLLENRKEIRVDHVDRIDVLVARCADYCGTSRYAGSDRWWYRANQSHGSGKGRLGCRKRCHGSSGGGGDWWNHGLRCRRFS